MIHVKNCICVLAIALIIDGCSKPTDSGEAIANYPIPSAQISVSGTVQVQTPAKSGKSAFSANCQLGYSDDPAADSVFNSATVTVDGLQLVQQYSDGTFYRSGMMLSAGDSVVFVIRHPVIGTIKQVLHVPPSITDCILQPNMPGKRSEEHEFDVLRGMGNGGGWSRILFIESCLL